MAEKIHQFTEKPTLMRTLIERQEDHEETVLNRDEHDELYPTYPLDTSADALLT